MAVMSVVEFPISIRKEQISVLNKKYEDARALYNATLNDALKRYRRITDTKEYRADQKILGEYYKKKQMKEKPDNEDEVKEIFAKRNDLFKAECLSKFGIVKLAMYHQKHYSKNISSCMANRSIANPVWAAMQKLMFGNGEKVKFKKFGELNSLTTDNRSGIRLMKDDKGYYALISNRKEGSKPMCLRIKQPKNDYEKDMISRKVKVISIIRRKKKDSYMYFMQLTVEGIPYKKQTADGTNLHPIGEGKVGIVIKDNNVYAVSDQGKTLHMKFDDKYEKYEDAVNSIRAEMTRLLQINNPDNYNDDGSIKKGVKQWVRSRQYRELSGRLQNLQRKNRESRKIQRNIIANEILKMGSDIYIRDKSYSTQKDKFDENNRKSNTEYSNLKNNRRNIQNFAPAALIDTINKKLSGNGCTEIHELRLPKEMYFYCHDENKANKTKFVDGTIVFHKKAYMEEFYRALCIMNFDGKQFNNNAVERGLAWI